MKLKIDKHTKAQIVQSLGGVLSAESEKQIEAEACKCYVPAADWWQITVGQFIDLSKGDLSAIGVKAEDYESLYALYALKSFAKFATTLGDALERMSVPQTEQDKAVMRTLPKQTLEEAMLIFVRGYFGLPSFESATGVKMIDFLIAKKDAYTKAMFEKGRADEYKRTARVRR